MVSNHIALCLHTLRADCNGTMTLFAASTCTLPPHAPCRLQHADGDKGNAEPPLCLHTLRADCNKRTARFSQASCPLPPHAPCRLQRDCDGAEGDGCALPPHAPCRLQRPTGNLCRVVSNLCLHTLRADCNGAKCLWRYNHLSLPPHAPCRLQRVSHLLHTSLCRSFASTRSVQIATVILELSNSTMPLCLHTLRADCNRGRVRALPHFRLCLHTLRADCNGRNAQNCNMHFSERVLSW